MAVDMLDGLRQGLASYYVVAVERSLLGNRPRLADPEWLEQLAPLARQVTVNEGAVVAVELTVRTLPAE